MGFVVFSSARLASNPKSLKSPSKSYTRVVVSLPLNKKRPQVTLINSFLGLKSFWPFANPLHELTRVVRKQQYGIEARGDN